MAKEFVTGVYRPEDDARLELPRSIGQALREVREFEESRRRRKLRILGQWPYTQSYDSPSSLYTERVKYRMTGERHPIDDIQIRSAPEPIVLEKLVGQIMTAIDRLRGTGVSLGSRMEYILDQVEPPLTPEARRLYKQRVGQRYAKRQTHRKEEDEAAWKAWLKAVA